MHDMYNIFHNYMFWPILGHLQVVLYSLKSEVTWWQGTLYRWWDLIHLCISLLWRVFVGSYLEWVGWQWRGIIDLVPVSIVVRGFPFVAQSCGNCCGLVCAWKSLCRYTPFCDGKKEEIKRKKGLRIMWISVGVAQCQYMGCKEYVHVRPC
jgi:hypothetical protein